ncbi:MAG: hypothetical protein AAFZ15_34355 [Bacteroidota bacterium]
MKEIKGNIIVQGITLDEFFKLLEQTIHKVLDERESALPKSEAELLPDEVPQKIAAKFLKYKTASPLRKYHNMKNGLKPKKIGRRVFYDKKELIEFKENHLFKKS